MLKVSFTTYDTDFEPAKLLTQCPFYARRRSFKAQTVEKISFESPPFL